MTPTPQLAKNAAPNLAEFYAATRQHTETLCEPLAIEDYIPQPVVDVSPPKWNIAHTTWFFETFVLQPHAPAYRVFHDAYCFLFNSYYNTVGARTERSARGALSRPRVSEVYAYRHYVDEQMHAFLQGELTDEIRAIVTLGIHHEQQHQELFLTDLKYTFGLNPLWPVYRADYAPEEISEAQAQEQFTDISAGLYGIGYDGTGFCFDNELGRHNVHLDTFRVGRNLITNAEWLEFMDAGGYRDFRLWHAEGWDWVRRDDIHAPLYWHEHEGAWHNFTLAGLRPIKPDAPVSHISFYEAAAFAEWRGARLPTEFEWEAAATQDQIAYGLRWEWTNSAYLPYPNFRKPAGAVGEYNGKFMINQMVLRGASIATPAGHSRPTYRNFFHPHLRWQFTGLRLAQ